MDIARYLDTIDRLCSRPFPAEHGWSDVGREGPGYWIAELAAGDGDAAHRSRTAEDLEAYREGLAQRLDQRWGAQPPWSTLTLRVRMERGEEIPEPWGSVGVMVDEVSLWRTDTSGRWVALGVATRGETEDARLLAIVTETDPP
ncbi:hypothetical protein [Streptomyces sp. enrichment culture]|uniref:hypothetical protein n=1 Tax=Streptomyces sp. enrichment culture TaxID=1795815 RepID=UPI003F56247C